MENLPFEVHLAAREDAKKTSLGKTERETVQSFVRVRELLVPAFEPNGALVWPILNPNEKAAGGLRRDFQVVILGRVGDVRILKKLLFNAGDYHVTQRRAIVPE